MDFKLVETRTGIEGEATFGSKHIVSAAMIEAVEPFLRRAYELGGGNGGGEEKASDDKESDRVIRPVRFVDLPSPPKKPTKRATASERMLDDKLSGLLPLGLKNHHDDLVCRIPLSDLAEIAGQAADAFIIEHLRSQGFSMNKEIYREQDAERNEMVYRQRR